jgi:hypothetical protein
MHDHEQDGSLLLLRAALIHVFEQDGVTAWEGIDGSHGVEGGGKHGYNGEVCLHPACVRSWDVPEYIAARDRHGQYGSSTLSESVWSLKEEKDRSHSYEIHEEADETEEIARAGGEESLRGIGAVS